MKRCILWLRRDLRLTDNPALSHALASAQQVLPVYIHAPEEDGRWRAGAASRWWLHHSLASLDQSLRQLGSRLIIRRGPSEVTLHQLVREFAAEGVFWNRRYEPAGIAHDLEVKRSLRDCGLTAESFNAALLFEPWHIQTGQGTPYKVFTPFWRACASRLEEVSRIAPAPAHLRAPAALARAPSLALEELALLPRVPWDAGLAQTWKVGEAGALQRLHDFRDRAVAAYPEHRNRPDLEGTSRLSPHLHFGEIGPRQLASVMLQHAARSSVAGERGAQAWLRQIGWREFAHHLLYHFPHTADQPMNPRFRAFPWSADSQALAAWQCAATGIPIVDAGMRELWATGWMHNRVRMVVASFLTKNLQVHWLEGAHWFWDTLVDADLANNTLGWQWTAGCGADASPYLRVFNPVLQARRFDPDRAYLRRWLPEIAALPDDVLPKPWTASAAVLARAGVVLGRHYPRPIVDLEASRAAALRGYAAVRP